MTLYVNGYRWLPMDPFDETLDDYSTKKQLKERAMGMWSDIEGNLKKAHKNLGLPSTPSTDRYVDATVRGIRKAIEEHVPVCPNAGTWIGKQGAATRVEEDLQWSDYQILRDFRLGMWTLRCDLGEQMMRECEAFLNRYPEAKQLMNSAKHDPEKGHWPTWSMGKVLNTYGVVQTLYFIAHHIALLSQEYLFGQHLRGEAFWTNKFFAGIDWPRSQGALRMAKEIAEIVQDGDAARPHH